MAGTGTLQKLALASNCPREQLQEQGLELSVQGRLRALQGHRDTSLLSRDGLRGFISCMENSLCAKDMVGCPGLPLQQSSENLSAE